MNSNKADTYVFFEICFFWAIADKQYGAFFRRSTYTRAHVHRERERKSETNRERERERERKITERKIRD